jgi:hypothetical protein
MGIFDRLKRDKLPKAESITQYRQLPDLVKELQTSHASDLKDAMQKHPDLRKAWTIIQDSAHPDYRVPIRPDLCSARRLMVAHLISAVTTGELVPQVSGES